MDELVKALKNFIVRDIIYIIGGSIVILSFVHLHGRINLLLKYADDDHTAICLLLVGLSYALGYCIQDTASWTRIVTTGRVDNPPKLIRVLYNRFLSTRWRNCSIQKKQYTQAEMCILERAPQDVKADRERIIWLMLVGTTIGPCAIISGMFLWGKTILSSLEKFSGFLQVNECVQILTIVAVGAVALLTIRFLPIVWVYALPLLTITLVLTQKKVAFGLALASCAILLGLLLTILGWIKAMQLTKNTEQLYNRLRQTQLPEYG